MRQTELTAVLQEIAPSRWARMGDEPHWQGSEREEVAAVAVCVDTTAANLQRAAELGADAIVAHHGWDGSCPDIIEAKGICVYRYHTNWDRAPEGNSVILARELGLSDIEGFNYSAIGNCPAQSGEQILRRAAEVVERPYLPYQGDLSAVVQRVGVMAGACFNPSFADEWAELIRRGAQVILSGELSQRSGRDFVQRGILVADIGHSSSEIQGMRHLAKLLAARLPVPVHMLEDYYRHEWLSAK